MAVCGICKLSYGQLDDVSFHGLPKDEEQKQKWFISIGKDLKKSATVCSRHFKQSDFKYKVYGDEVRRFILPGAVPSVTPPDDDFQFPTYPPSSESDSEPESTECEEKEKKIKCNPYIDGRPLEDEYSGTSNKDYLNSKNSSEQGAASVASEGATAASNSTETSVEENPSSDDRNVKISLYQQAITSSKRKQELPLATPRRYFRPRYIGDLRREDFTSDESFRVVQNYYEKTRKKIEDGG